jgi:hypothetical protein
MCEDQVCHSPILESFNFRVSRVSLDSINRLVNIEKHTRDFGEEFTTLK